MAGSDLLRDLFGTPKPVIAMAHFAALPGTPAYDASTGVEEIVEALRRDLRVLLDGGVDAVLFCNEADRPYTLHADLTGVATMARTIGELLPIDRPFGTDFLWDPRAALALATAVGAAFIREVVTGVYESDMGIWQPDAADLYRYRQAIGADGVRVFANITPEFASPLGARSPAERARSALVSSLVDAILIAGPRAGAAPDLALVETVKAEVGDDAPVLLNTGARADTIADYLRVADGVIVGSWLKVDGYTWNPVDPTRVRAFMQAVRAAR
jgi:membrane complex biogenesis BtpA family protein